MSAKTNSIRIGIFVLLAVFLFIAGLLAFGARSYFAKKILFETAITGEVYGLSIGSRVELRGVPIGKVSRIDFARNIYPDTKTDFIVVEFEVERQIYSRQATTQQGKEQQLHLEVTKGLRMILKSQGITGTSILTAEYIDPKDNPPPDLDYKPAHLYVPSAPGQFSRMLESIQKSLENIERLDVASISQGVTNVLGGVNQFTVKLNQLDLQAIGTNANALLVEVKDLGARVEVTIEDVRTTLKSMKLDSISQNADRLLAGLQETNTKLQKVLDSTGTLPLHEAIGDVRQTLQTLNDVLTELKQYPSGFIFGQPPPPAKAVQPQKN